MLCYICQAATSRLAMRQRPSPRGAFLLHILIPFAQNCKNICSSALKKTFSYPLRWPIFPQKSERVLPAAAAVGCVRWYRLSRASGGDGQGKDQAWTGSFRVRLYGKPVRIYSPKASYSPTFMISK